MAVLLGVGDGGAEDGHALIEIVVDRRAFGDRRGDEASRNSSRIATGSSISDMEVCHRAERRRSQVKPKMA
eukprot:9302481-Alexandrium_andersonii.AAC.1